MGSVYPLSSPSLFLFGSFAIWTILFTYVFVVAVVLRRVRCPWCNERGRLGPPPGKPRSYTAFCCPECGWIVTKGIIRAKFVLLEQPTKAHAKKHSEKAEKAKSQTLTLELEN